MTNDQSKTAIGEAGGRLRALVAYTEHKGSCQKWERGKRADGGQTDTMYFDGNKPCTCGLDAMLSAPVVSAEKSSETCVTPDPVAAALLNAMAQDVLLGAE